MARTTWIISLHLAALCAVFTVRVVGSSAPGSLPVPRLKVNLDLPPEERWAPVLRHWDLKELKELFQKAIHQSLPVDALPLVVVVGELIDDLLPEPYAGEIRGVAKTLDLDVGEVTVINMLYEFSAFCTSIVAQDTNGTIWHSRNLDFAMTDILKNLTAVLDFQSKGKTVYTTTSFVGQVGVFTGMKPHKFTISLNERDQGTEGENIINVLKALLLKKIKFTSFLARDALANDDSFDEALQRVISEEEVAPVYAILAGVKPGEGAVVTRDRDAPLDVWRLDLSGDRWFLLETNYDHWKAPPPDDDRRDPGNKAMEAVGQMRINNSTMWDVLSIQPVLNDITVYTALMSAAKPDVYSSRIRFLP